MSTEGATPTAAETLRSIAQGSARDLRSLQIKLTYVGPQTKSVPTVVFTSFHHLIQLDWFASVRHTELSYANDDLHLWTFTTTPEELQTVAERLAQLDVMSSPQAAEPWVALALVLRESRLGEWAMETVLDRAGAAAVVDAIFDGLATSNGVAREVMKLYRQASVGGT